MTFGRTPSNEQSVAISIALHLQEWNLIGHLVNLGLACANHLLVVLWVGGDDTLVGISLKTDITVLIALHPWICPIAYTTFVAKSWIVVIAELLWCSLWLNSRELIELRNLPEACAISQISVGEKYHWSHVLKGNLAGLVSKIKAVGRGRCRNNYSRTLAIASVERLE